MITTSYSSPSLYLEDIESRPYTTEKLTRFDLEVRSPSDSSTQNEAELSSASSVSKRIGLGSPGWRIYGSLSSRIICLRSPTEVSQGLIASNLGKILNLRPYCATRTSSTSSAPVPSLRT